MAHPYEGQPFFGGTPYVSGPFRRVATFAFNGGTATLQAPVPGAFLGETQYYQVWLSDPGDAQGVGLSNGLSVTYVP